MLVLRRKAGEAIVMNKIIIVRVLAVEENRVKLGIDAPDDVIIVREELLDDISSDNSISEPRRPLYQDWPDTEPFR